MSLNPTTVVRGVSQLTITGTNLGGATAVFIGGTAVAIAGAIVLITGGSSAETEKPAPSVARVSFTPWIAGGLYGGGARLQF